MLRVGSIFCYTVLAAVEEEDSLLAERGGLSVSLKRSRCSEFAEVLIRGQGNTEILIHHADYVLERRYKK